jgi:uncharacterized protein with PQ loop repeat
MAYHITGLISAAIFLLTVGGLWTQLRFIFERKERFAGGRLIERPTAILSLNQFVSSFLAFFAFFLYGCCLQRFNHYLVWPRLAAALLTLAVLYELMRDRRDTRSAISFSVCLGLIVVAPAFLLFNPAAAVSGRLLSEVLIVIVTVILAQGYLHQVVLIRKTGLTGAVALRMHQFFLLKDISTLVFALTMGIAAGWPLLLLSTVSAITKLITIWHFRWVRLSPIARERRNTPSSGTPETLLALG